MNFKDLLKECSITKRLYYELKNIKYSKEFSSFSIIECIPVESKDERIRINLIIPLIRKSGVFGGISTALKFFTCLFKHYACEARILITEEKYHDKKRDISINGFSFNRQDSRCVVFLHEDRHLEVRKTDFFIYVDWRSAYAFSKVNEWQIRKYDLVDHKAIYLIQDFEPAFCAWSSEFAEAESTYRRNCDSLIAVFNSKQLFEYFESYNFCKKFYFKPALADGLKKELLSKKGIEKREKRILIYGRPIIKRNAFSIVKEALALWSERYPSSNEWEIISLGEQYADIRLKNNTIKCYGKVELEEYAKLMCESYVGISLMVSPHPSYPPLEMSTFGVRTITNSFANKDLSSFNSNIVSLDMYSPYDVCAKLVSICDEYDDFRSHLCIDEEYVFGSSFDDAVSDVIKALGV